MTKYFLETSVIINYIRGKKETVVLVDSLEGELTSSFVCLSELYEGIFRVREKSVLEETILDFFSGLSEVFGVDKDVAKMFGSIRANLKEKGQVIEDIDIFLAATCVAYNLTLVTANSAHFRRVEELEIVEA